MYTKIDLFDYELGTKPQLTHKPLIVGDRGKPICVYAIAVTTNGGEYMELMNMQEIEKCRAVSKASSSPHSPWVKWFDQMAKKTVCIVLQNDYLRTMQLILL